MARIYFRNALAAVGMLLVSSQPALADPVPLTGIAQLSLGGIHSCAVTTAATMKCWGGNDHGQIGDGSTIDRLTAVNVPGFSGVRAIAAGFAHTCAATMTGVKCWGMNNHGQLGNGTVVDSVTPVSVIGLGGDVRALAAGQTHTCALTDAGALKCWGFAGTVGDGSFVDQPAPVDVIGFGGGTIAVAAGGIGTCAIAAGGAAFCWGGNIFGQVGDGSTLVRSEPTAVIGLGSGVEGITAGFHHACATVGGGVRCWGSNEHGQIGDGTHVDRLTPVAVTGLTSGMHGPGGGFYYTCVGTSGGEIRCWGGGSSGQLGNDMWNDQLTAVAVVELGDPVSSVSTGLVHACAILPQGRVKCWGSNGYGQLGNNDNSLSMAVPVDALEEEFIFRGDFDPM